MTDYREFFSLAQGDTAIQPYPYQTRLATESWPDYLDIPTGLGKTAAIVIAWLYKRIQGDPHTPRRLVYCLPMRVLVEQTRRNVDQWLQALAREFEKQGIEPPSVHMLLGGEADTEWVQRPEHHAILIGTQDMLLSRALMRGYGISRYQWPIDFALLHNDAFWIYDEVQLMGPALATSAQLEAFRRTQHNTPANACRSLWASATLRPDWLATVDFQAHQPSTHRLSLDEAERREPAVAYRIGAPKNLQTANTILDEDSRKSGYKIYLADVANEVAAAHRAGNQTLVIVNRVARAQGLYQALARITDTPRVLLHARFRPKERRDIEHQIQQACGTAGRIVIATQAVEAGIDISSHILFTELAPWSSLVQRFGRCNRAGEHNDADIFWIDITAEDQEAAPYEPAALEAARLQLTEQGDSASPTDLASISEAPPAGQVLRRRDFRSLFNTDPDLSGFDVDISPYIRDSGTPPLQLFWREFTDAPGEQPAPKRDELCPAGIGQVDSIRRGKRRAWVWDTLAEQWSRLTDNPRPGMTLMLRADDGGYDPELGFQDIAKAPVEPLVDAGNAPAAYGDDRFTQTDWLNLPKHLQDAGEQARSVCQALGESSDAVPTAALWHDVGKAHPAFQNALAQVGTPPEPDALWAKSGGRGRLIYGVYQSDTFHKRPLFRHELASALAWLVHNAQHSERDLIAYLIAAHHGKVRMGLRALPGEAEPDDPNRLFARGVWDGDELPELVFEGHDLPATTLRLDLMRLGDGPQGPSWTARTADLLDTLGPFRLAWLETLVRISDWRASSIEPDSADRWHLE